MSYRKLYRESDLTKVAPLASILWKRVARYSLFFFFFRLYSGQARALMLRKQSFRDGITGSEENSQL